MRFRPLTYCVMAALLLAAYGGTGTQPAEQPPAPAQTSTAQQATEAPTLLPAATELPQLAATLPLPPPADHLMRDDPELAACLLRALGQEVYYDLRGNGGIPSQQQMIAMGPCMAILSPGGGPPSGTGEIATAPAPEPTAAPAALTCEDAHYTFTDIGLVLIALEAGNSDPMAPMANPSSLFLEDGRVRLFFTNAGAGIGSAISTDGLSFAYEGMRIDGRAAKEPISGRCASIACQMTAYAYLSAPLRPGDSRL